MPPTLDNLAPSEIAAVRDELVAVYRAAFAPPLYETSEEDAARFAGEILPRHAGREGFR